MSEPFTFMEIFSYILVLAFFIYIWRRLCCYEDDVSTDEDDLSQLEMAMQEQILQDIMANQIHPPAFWKVTIHRLSDSDRLTTELVNTDIEPPDSLKPTNPNYTFITLPDNTIQLVLVDEPKSEPEPPSEFVPIQLLTRDIEEEFEHEDIPLPGQVFQN